MSKRRSPSGAPRLARYSDGPLLREARLAAGASAKNLAAKLGLSQPETIYNWEKGRVLMTLHEFASAAAALGTTVKKLRGGGGGH